MSSTKTITFTVEECERIANIIAYNIDSHLTPEMKKSAKREQIESVVHLKRVIESDQALMRKFI